MGGAPIFPVSLKVVDMRSLRILLIEDDPDSGEAMCVLLRKQDAEVDWASTAEEAIALYRRDSDIDLIFVDLMLPGMDGATLIERLSEIALRRPIRRRRVVGLYCLKSTRP